MSLKRTLEIRQITPEKIRVFKVPALNFDVEVYAGSIDSMTESPLDKLVNTKIIFDAMSDQEQSDILDKFSKIHTQSVERRVKLVTGASAAVYWGARREGYLKNRVEARRVVPNFDTKQDYNLE